MKSLLIVIGLVSLSFAVRSPSDSFLGNLGLLQKIKTQLVGNETHKKITFFHKQKLRAPSHLEAAARRLRIACVQETSVDEHFIDISVEGYVSDDPKLKCYIACVLDHANMVFQLSVDQNVV